MVKIVKFEDLPIWKKAIKLTRDIYDITAIGKFAKDFGLRDQIKRAIVSVSSNIVEGFEKNNNNEFIRYLKIAKGSVGEVRNQLYIAFAVGYLSRKKFDYLNSELVDLAKQIGSFISYLERKRKRGEFGKRY